MPMRELRWNCQINGCFRNLCPKLGVFDECFPGRIGMSDVDGIVEIAGRFLVLEWKSEGGGLTTGQRIMFERLTALSPKITIIVVSGDPRLMEVDAVQVIERGKLGQRQKSTVNELKDRIKAWCSRASEARIRPSLRQSA